MDDPLGTAYGLVRCANLELLSRNDQTGKALDLGMQGLDLEAMFSDLGVSPAPVQPAGGPADSLAAAATLLATQRSRVPLAMVALIDSLQRQVA